MSLRNGFLKATMCMCVATAPVSVAAAELEEQQPSVRLSGHESDVYGLAFSGDGKLLISGSSDGTIKVWDVAAKKLERTIDVPDKEGVFGIVFSPDSNTGEAAGTSSAAEPPALTESLREWKDSTGRQYAKGRRAATEGD